MRISDWSSDVCSSDLFGQIGRVTSITLSFPFLWRVPAFNTIVTQGPEISGITPLKYDVTLLNRDGQQVQVQFTTLQSSATYPGFGQPVRSEERRVGQEGGRRCRYRGSPCP